MTTERLQLPTLQPLPWRNHTYNIGPPQQIVDYNGNDSENLFPHLNLLTGAEHSRILKQLDPTYNGDSKSVTLKEFGLATGDLGAEIQAALDSLTEVKPDGRRGYSTISIQHEMGRLPKAVEEVPLATTLIMGSRLDQKNPILQNMYLSQSAAGFKNADRSNKQQRQIDEAPLPPGEYTAESTDIIFPTIPDVEPVVSENISVNNRVATTKLVGPTGPGLSVTNEFSELFPGSRPQVQPIPTLSNRPTRQPPPPPIFSFGTAIAPPAIQTSPTQAVIEPPPPMDDNLSMLRSIVTDAASADQQYDFLEEPAVENVQQPINKLNEQARELENFQQETQLVSKADRTGSSMLARNIFIETTDEQSTAEFLRTCSQITQGLNGTPGLSAMDNLLFMEFLTSNAGHQIMVQAQLKVRITDGALFIGNDKDLAENMFNFLQQQLNTNMIIIDKPMIYNGDLVGFGMFLDTLGSTTDDKLDLGANKHIKYLVARYNSLQNTMGVEPLLVRHTTLVNDLVNLEQIMDSNWLESVASLMSAYSSETSSRLAIEPSSGRAASNKIAALTYPSLDEITNGYGSLTMEFQGNVLAPVLTTGSEIMLRTMFSDLGSTLSQDFSELREALAETDSSGDLSRLREYNPAQLSDWIVSDWFEYGKVPLASQFITLPTAENVETKNSLIAPSSLRTLLTNEISERNNEEMKNMLNMQGVFAFCKAVYTYLYQADRITLLNLETGEAYLQAAVNEWHNNITYGAMIDRTKVTVQAATTLVDFIKMILQPTYIVPTMLSEDSTQQPAITNNIGENNIANIKMEDEAAWALAEMHRNEQLFIENRIALQSIQEAVDEEQTQRLAQNKQLEILDANFTGR